MITDFDNFYLLLGAVCGAVACYIAWDYINKKGW